MSRHPPLAALRLVSAAFLCSALALGTPSAASADAAWVVLDTPKESVERLTGSAALVEVAGRAGSGALRPYDLVIVLDVSESTLQPVGFDHNRDVVPLAQKRDRAVRISECMEICRGDIGVAQQVLAEDLTALQFRGCLRGAKHAQL